MSRNGLNESVLYIDMDSIFDTRITALRQVDNIAADTLLKNNLYRYRDTDLFNLYASINLEEYNAVYADRDNELLKNSQITNIFPVIRRIVDGYSLNIVSGAQTKELSIEININPYSLDIEEQDLLIELFKYKLDRNVKLTFIQIPFNLLTYAELLHRYSAAIMYSGNEWIKQHAEEIAVTKASDFYLICPRLFERDVSRLKMEEKKADVQMFKMLMLSHIDVEYIDVEYFSLYPVANERE